MSLKMDKSHNWRHFLAYSVHQSSNTTSKTWKGDVESSSRNAKLYLYSLMEEIKLVILKEADFDNREKAKLLAFVWCIFKPSLIPRHLSTANKLVMIAL